MNEIIGWGLLSLPLVALIVAVVLVIGWRGAIFVFGGTVLGIGCITAGTYLVSGGW